MGTETDLSAFLGAIPRVSLKGSSEENFGFHLSKEGRSFLQALFNGYKRRTGFGEGKIASIVSDSFPSNEAQSREVDRLKSALRRWSKDSQSELWPKDPTKNIRLLARLETEMMAVEEMRKILSDVAQTDLKIQIGLSLSNFIYGKSNQEMESKVQKMSQNLCGTYQTYVIEPAPDFGRNDIAEEERIEKGDVKALREYYRFSPVQGCAFVLAQKFFLSGKFENYEDANRQTSIEQLFSGFAFPLHENEIHVFLTSHGPHRERTHEFFSPAIHTGTPLAPWFQMSSKRRSFLKQTIPHVDEMLSIDIARKNGWNPITIKPFVDKLEKTLKHCEWNLL